MSSKMKNNKIDIEQFGDYRMGLSLTEINTYLANRSGLNGKKLQALINKFFKISGVNTGVMTSAGVCLTYRHDVKRFADKIFEGKKTYFD